MRSQGKRRGNPQLARFLGFLALMLLLAAAWKWTPLSELITPERLSGFFAQFDRSPALFAVVLGAVVIANLLMAPLSVLTVASALLLGPWQGFACAMAGALISGCLAFLAGQSLGGELIERLSGTTVHRISKRLSERGVMAVAILRLLPVAPYTIVNLVAGASHLRLGTFMLGTAIGLVPPLGALTVFSESLYAFVSNPGARSLGVLAILAGVIVAIALALRHMLKKL